MDVRLPDGTVVTNVPEGITQAELMARVGGSSSEPAKPAKSEPTTAEKIAGNPATRFAMGAASPVLGLLQLGEKAYGGSAVDDTVKTGERMAQAGKSTGGLEFNPVSGPILAAEKLTGLDLAGTAGAMMNPLGLFSLAKLPAAISKMGRAGQGAAIGGASGVAMPVTSEGDYATEKGKQIATAAGVGALAPTGISLISKVLEAGRNLLPGSTEKIASNVANQAAGTKRDEIVKLLSQNDQLVPGARASAGEVAAPAGSAEFAGLQNIVTKKTPTPYSDMEGASEAARLAAIRSIGQDEAALKAARKTRSDNAEENYGPIRYNMVNPKSDTQLMLDAIRARQASKADALQTQGRYQTTAAQQEELAAGRGPRLSPNQTPNEPQMNVGATGGDARSPSAYPVEGQPRIPPRYTENQQRVPEARTAADEAGIRAQESGKTAKYLETQMEILRETVGLENKSLQDFLTRPSMKTALQDAAQSAAEKGEYFPRQRGESFTVANLQRMKESLDQGIAAAKKAVENGKRPELSPEELQGTRKAFIEWMSSKVPRWAEARQQFRMDSIPINRMEVGQELEKALTTAVPGGERATPFANATREAARTIKKSTGDSIYQSLDQVLAPKQVDAVESVIQSLARKDKYEDLARKGTSAAADLIDLAVPKLPAAGGPLNVKYTIIKNLVNRVAGNLDNRSMALLAERMQDPQDMAKLMNLSPPQQKKVIEALLQQGSRYAAIGAGQD